ncbi:MAG: adenylate/guanylate cyclase domain-containing protein [Pseudomonadota bacterium]
MLMLYVFPPRALQQLSAAALDTYQRAAPRPYDPSSPVHVVDIDEASLDALGQWPWPRTYLAELTDRLFELGAVAIGFDILFAEPDRTSPDFVVENLSRFSTLAPDIAEALETYPDHDLVFAEALAGGPTVLAVAGARDGVAPAPKAGIAFTGRRPDAALSRYAGALAPLPELAEAATGIGGISLDSGTDGITRAVPMVALYDDVMMPSFSAELLRVAQGAGGHILQTTEASGQASGGTARPVAMRTGGATFPLDGNGHLRLHFPDDVSARVTSASMFLTETSDEALRARVEGRIVLVGSSAQALFDIRATPLSPETPGVLLHAQILDQIIAGDFLVRPDWAPGLEFVMIFFTGIAVTALAVRDRPILGLAATIVAVGGAFSFGWSAYGARGLLFDPVMPALTAIAVYLPATTMSVFGKERARRAIRDRFGYFLPRQVIDQIAGNPDQALAPTGASHDITVMFVDMRRFSTLTERMEPDDVFEMLNLYLSSASEALVESGATIDKYIGDAVMAFWNAPLAVPDHAARAARAIFAVEAAVAEANVALEERGLPLVETRIGVNTGPAFVGLMGSEERYNYSCVGDTVTLAARLEEMTRRYGVSNLVGEDTSAALPEGLVAVPIDYVQVRGRDEPERISTVLQAGESADALSAAVYAVRSAMDSGDWPIARRACSALGGVACPGVDADRLSQALLQQVIEMESGSVGPRIAAAK